MALSKLKVEERETLYYKKYQYKTVATMPGAFYTHKVKNIEQYKKKISDLTEGLSRYPLYMPLKFDEDDYKNIGKLIKYINKFIKEEKGIMRKDSQSITFFTNDLAFLQKVPSTQPLNIIEAQITPAGIKYFKNTIPANYRVYLRDCRVNTGLRQDILDYLEKTENVSGSIALRNWLTRVLRWDHTWCSNTYFINYNEPSQLTMMALLFSEVLGKNYKLEQK